MHEIIRNYTVGKSGNISCLQFVNDMLPVFIVFLYEHLLVAMFELYWLERSLIRPQEAGHLSIFAQGAYIERCRLKVEDATLSIDMYRSPFLLENK